MKLSQVLSDSKEACITFPGGGKLNVVYAPTKITPLTMSQFGNDTILHSTEQGVLLARTTVELVQRWDLEEDEPTTEAEGTLLESMAGEAWRPGMTVALKEARLQRLPMDLLATILAEIFKANQPNPTNAPRMLKTSDARSLKRVK